MLSDEPVRGVEPPIAEGAVTEAAPTEPVQEELTGFRVALANFTGPFDLLLQLIGSKKMDVTEVALAAVTDEFIAYTRSWMRWATSTRSPSSSSSPRPCST